MAFLLNPIAVPDPPVSVFVRCNSKNRSAEIWWQPGKENYAPILNFIVQYNTTFQPDLWYDIATNISQNNRRIVVTMSPWGNYTFRVISRNKIGLSLPSMKSFNVCTTEPGVPDKNPENVIGEGDQPGNLVIFWTVRLFMLLFFYSSVRSVLKCVVSWLPRRLADFSTSWRIIIANCSSLGLKLVVLKISRSGCTQF